MCVVRFLIGIRSSGSRYYVCTCVLQHFPARAASALSPGSLRLAMESRNFSIAQGSVATSRGTVPRRVWSVRQRRHA